MGAPERIREPINWRARRPRANDCANTSFWNAIRFHKTPYATDGCRRQGQEVEIYDFPDGRLEIPWKGLPLAYAVFDKLQRVSHAAIVENKRLGEVLAWIKQRQDALSIPSGHRVAPRRSS